VATRFKPYIYGSLLAGIVGSNPVGKWMSLCCECCVLSGRGLCDEQITRQGRWYRLRCFVVCDLETSRMRRTCKRSVAVSKENISINFLLFVYRSQVTWGWSSQLLRQCTVWGRRLSVRPTELRHFYHSECDQLMSTTLRTSCVSKGTLGDSHWRHCLNDTNFVTQYQNNSTITDSVTLNRF
jgi:hypothetical protein